MNGERVELEVHGERFAALRFGPKSGRPLLCLHGFPDHPPNFDELANGLSVRGFRVTVPWLRGYAPSPMSGSVSLAALVKDATHLLDAISEPGEPRYLVGHDWGAAITYGVLASDAPVAAACAISVPHPAAFASNALRSPAQLKRSSYMLRFQSRRADDAVRADNHAQIRALWRAWSPGLTLEAHRWEALRETLEASGARPLDYYRAAATPDGMRWIRALAATRITTPTTIIFGARDGCIDADMARGSQRYFAGELGLEVLPDVGHFIHLETPRRLADRVAARLLG